MEKDKGPSGDCGVSGQVPARASVATFKFVRWALQLRLFRRRTVLWPTWAGFFCVTLLLFILIAGWLLYGESYLAETHRSQPDILVVEGWIGRQGVRVAVNEFERGGYRYIVASGGLTSGRWEDKPTSYAEMAAVQMIQSGVPKEKVIIARSESTESHRTFESAVAVWRTLHDAGIKPKSLNVFTLGPHARRSALVFAKVNSHGPQIGVIGWLPPEYKAEAWWNSSDRSRELLEETVGYLYELLLNSGRRSNSALMEVQTWFGEASSSSAQLSPR
jgi:DUF218 domain